MWLDIHQHREAVYYKVYLDGKKLDYCFAANEEEGWADCYKKDDTGKFITEKIFNDVGLATFRLYGKIELIDTRNES